LGFKEFSHTRREVLIIKSEVGLYADQTARCIQVVSTLQYLQYFIMA